MHQNVIKNANFLCMQLNFDYIESRSLPFLIMVCVIYHNLRKLPIICMIYRIRATLKRSKFSGLLLIFPDPLTVVRVYWMPIDKSFCLFRLFFDFYFSVPIRLLVYCFFVSIQACRLPLIYNRVFLNVNIFDGDACTDDGIQTNKIRMMFVFVILGFSFKYLGRIYI